MIRVDDNSGIKTITLDRPDKRNAMQPAMLASATEAVRTAGDDATHTKAVLLCGAGRVFSAGFDLAACADDDTTQPTLAALLRGLSDLVTAMRSIPQPVVIAAHGAAIAGAAALLAAADIAVTNRDAKIGYPVVRVGISPAVSAPTLLPKIGPGHARARLTDTQLISGTRAHELGFADVLVDTPEDVMPEAMRTAETLAAKPGIGLARTKALLNRLEAASLHVNSDTGSNAGLDASLSLLGGEESQKMLAALWKV